MGVSPLLQFPPQCLCASVANRILFALCFHILTNCFPRNSLVLITIQIARGVYPRPVVPFLVRPASSLKHPTSRTYIRLNGSISTSTAVSGISFRSRYVIAPPSTFASSERFGDFSKNWKRCSFFNFASGAAAGPRIRRPLPSCGEKYRSEEHTLNSSHGYISYAVFC